MTISAPKFLFVPVSSAQGVGEYMRSLIVANEIQCRWPEAQIHFMLSRQAPYAQSCPFPTELLDDTPTKQIKAVNEFMSALRPDFVIFDASGRRSQLEHANKLGAKVVFLSQHKRKRSRGLKITRARVTDSHWVVQPEFIIGPVNWVERVKLRLINKPEPVVTGPIFVNPNKTKQLELLGQYGLTAEQYLIFNAGSGGHKFNDGFAADVFAKAAKAIYRATKLPCLMVFGPNYPKELPVHEGVVAIKSLNHEDFINLLDASKAAVLSGGDTLLQAIALKKPTLTVAVSKDQDYRIRMCATSGLAVSSHCDVDAMLKSLVHLISPENLAELQASLALCDCVNGLDIGMKEISKLFYRKFGEI